MLIIPEGYGTYNIIAFDPGTQTTGVAIMEIDSRTDNIISILPFTLHSKRLPVHAPLTDIHSNRLHQLFAFQHYISELFLDYRPSAVIAEAPFYYRKCPGAYQPLLEVVAMLQRCVVDYSFTCEFHTYEPLVVKRYIGAALSSDKNSVKTAILSNSSVISKVTCDLEQLDDHAIDAIAVGYAFLQTRKV